MIIKNPAKSIIACQKLIILLLAILPLSASWAEKQTLKNPEWLMSLEQRALLNFITECALRNDQLLTIESSGILFEYYGKLGVAPNWNGYPSSLTAEEQRWVTACVLARVNYFGTPVAFNLRTEADSELQLSVTSKQITLFPFHEGAFFGNIFSRPAKKYACRGDAAVKTLVDKNRICTLPSVQNKKVSECGFTIIDNCNDKLLRERDGIIYKELFHVWLKEQ